MVANILRLLSESISSSSLGMHSAMEPEQADLAGIHSSLRWLLALTMEAEFVANATKKTTTNNCRLVGGAIEAKAMGAGLLD